jgi:hypothetical protein
MGGAQSCEFRKGSKRNRAVPVALDFAAHSSNEIYLRAATRLARMTTPAGPESGYFCRFWLAEEKNLPRVRAARWARRPAIDPRRTNRIDECAIHPRVVQSDCGKASSPPEGGDCRRQRVEMCQHWLIGFFPTTISKTIPAALSESCGQTDFPGSFLTHTEMVEKRLLLGSIH